LLYLLILDLLIQNKDLTKSERKKVKKVAQKTLETLQTYIVNKKTAEESSSAVFFENIISRI